MDILTEKRQRNYLPYDVDTKIAVVRRMNDSGWSAKRVKSYYHLSRAVVFRGFPLVPRDFVISSNSFFVTSFRTLKSN